jgi:hypothetical protein
VGGSFTLDSLLNAMAKAHLALLSFRSKGWMLIASGSNNFI